MTRQCFARIYLNRLRNNFQRIQRLVGSSVELFPVVKADAYGHNSIECAKALIKEGVKTFCVACAEEAIEILDSGVNARFILLSGVFPGEEKIVVERGLIPVVSEAGACERLAKEAQKQGRNAMVHLKIDTGMGRLGVCPEGFSDLLKSVSHLKRLEIEGVLSHLSSADSHSPEAVKYTKAQIDDFSLIVKALQAQMPSVRYFHLAGSAGMVKYPEARFNSARPGLMLYGANPFYPEKLAKLNLDPVMSLVSRICLIKTLPQGSRISYGGKTILKRTSRVGVVPAGYADGIPRSAPPGFEFLVKGKPAPLLGVVTMDLIMVDLTDIPEAKPGDEILLFGREGRSELRVEKLAQACHTISYEIFTRLGKRVKREYLCSE